MRTWLLLLITASLAWAEEPTIPRLVTPELAERRDAEGVPLHRDVVRRLGSGLFRIGFWHNAPPAFSPSGETVYVAAGNEILAFDAKTGKQRFAYLYGGYNLRADLQNKQGLRVEFDQGPLEGKYVVLAHDTGKELRRGERSGQNVLPYSTSPVIRVGEKRALVFEEVPRNPLEGPPDRQRVRLWDVERGSAIAELGEAGIDGGHIAISPDAKWLTFCAEGTLQIHDGATGRAVREVPLNFQAGDHDIRQAAWSSDSTRVYAWRRRKAERQLVEVDVASGEVRTLLMHPWASGTPVVSPDGKWLAYLHNEDPKSEAPVWKVIKLGDLSAYRTIDVRPALPAATFSPDGESLWLLGECGLARYDLRAGKLAGPGCDPFSLVTALSFSQDGSQVFGVAGAERITWDVATGREVGMRQPFESFRTSGGHRCIAIDDTGNHTVWYGDSYVRYVERGKEKAKFYASNGWVSQDYMLSPDRKRIVHDAYYGDLVLADFRTGEKLLEIYPVTRPRQDYRMAIAPDNRTLALLRGLRDAGINKPPTEIELWDLDQHKKVGQLKQELDLDDRLLFSADSKQLRVWHKGNVFLWDLATKKIVSQRKSNQQAPYYPVMADGQRFFEDGVDLKTYARVLHLKDLTEDTIVRGWKCYDWRASALALSPDESLLAVASPEGPVVLVDLQAEQ